MSNQHLLHFDRGPMPAESTLARILDHNCSVDHRFTEI